MESKDNEKMGIEQVVEPVGSDSIKDGQVVSDQVSDEGEVFKANADGVNFRTITWRRLIIILLKVQVATGVLSIPSALGSLGAVPGAINIVGWQAINTCELSGTNRRHLKVRADHSRHGMSSH